jgi:replicative DNA helicase
MLTEQITPQAREAEQSVLGSMLMARGAIVEASEKLTSEMFFRANHQSIWDVIIHLHQFGEVDLINVCEELRRRGKLDEVGGPAYLTALVESCPSAANIVEYIKPVKEAFILRKYIIAAEQIKNDAFSTLYTADELTARCEKMVMDLGRYQLTAEPHEIDSLIADQRARIMEAARNPNGVTGVLSGFPDLDKLTNGFRASELITVAGASAMGKSALASQISSHVLKTSNRPVIIFSLEMSKEQWMDRMVSAEARVEGHSLRNGRMQQDEWTRVNQVQTEYAKLPMHVVDIPALTTAEIKAQSRRIAAMHGTPALIVIDYLQIAEPAERIKEERIRVTQMVRDFKNLARQIDCPVMCLSQLSRALATRENKRPTLSDLRETSAIEAESDVVLFIYRPSYYVKQKHDDYDGEAEFDEIIIGKQRNGPVGTVPVKFISDYARFDNAAMGGNY